MMDSERFCSHSRSPPREIAIWNTLRLMLEVARFSKRIGRLPGTLKVVSVWRHSMYLERGRGRGPDDGDTLPPSRGCGLCHGRYKLTTSNEPAAKQKKEKR